MEKKPNNSNSNLIKSIGPGILLAGAAIGGSHLHWSTKAGALYGFTLVWVIIAVNIFKYPFFEFTHRYTIAKNESIIDGYKKLSRTSLNIFLIIAFISGIINIAGVTTLTAALAGTLFGNFFNFTREVWIIIISLFSLALLAYGNYPALDKVIKYIVFILGLFTFIAVIVALFSDTFGETQNFSNDFAPANLTILFLIALMGWMPAPIDVAVFSSLWIGERAAQTKYKPTLKESLIDFHIGYIGTALLALAFLALGALVLYGTSGNFPETGIAFSNLLISIYTKTYGEWTFYFIALAAFLTMLSTTLTCFDGYTRVLHRSVNLNFKDNPSTKPDKFYWSIMVFFAVVTIWLGYSVSTLLQMLTIAAVIAFLTAPFLAVMNYILITSDKTPKEFRPNLWLKILSWFGIAFLMGFSLVYVWVSWI